MIRRPPRSTQSRSSAASDVYKRQVLRHDGLPPHLGDTDTLTDSAYRRMRGRSCHERALAAILERASLVVADASPSSFEHSSGDTFDLTLRYESHQLLDSRRGASEREYVRQTHLPGHQVAEATGSTIQIRVGRQQGDVGGYQLCDQDTDLS